MFIINKLLLIYLNPVVPRINDQDVALVVGHDARRVPEQSRLRPSTTEGLNGALGQVHDVHPIKAQVTDV